MLATGKSRDGAVGAGAESGPTQARRRVGFRRSQFAAGTPPGPRRSEAAERPSWAEGFPLPAACPQAPRQARGDKLKGVGRGPVDELLRIVLTFVYD
jgi:hypothetical protein